MISSDHLVVGNAYADGAPRGGWFVARFIDQAFGLRCRQGRHRDVLSDAQGDFELKLRHHHSGDAEKKRFPFNKSATTFSMLLGDGHFILYFCHGAEWGIVELKNTGDYALWGPNVGHRWIVCKATSVFTLRCPAVDLMDQEETPIDRIPNDLKLLFQDLDGQ